jgi:hypothetical protein
VPGGLGDEADEEQRSQRRSGDQDPPVEQPPPVEGGEHRRRQGESQDQEGERVGEAKRVLYHDEARPPDGGHPHQHAIGDHCSLGAIVHGTKKNTRAMMA